MAIPLSSGRVQISVFLISAVLISYQILLVKLFSIQYGHHFAYLIISIALLGFGASGTCILLMKDRLMRRFFPIMCYLPLCLLASIWISLYLNRLIAFNPLFIIWQNDEILRLCALSLSLLVPFFLGALSVGMAFTAMPANIPRIYFATLTGSGMGSLIILLPFYHISPQGMMFVMSLVLVGAGMSVSGDSTRKAISFAFLLATILFFTMVFRHEPLAMSPYKDMVQAENLMEAEKEVEIFGPHGLVTVIDSPAYHYLPDMSLNCPHPLPRQKGLFADGNTVGAIHEFSGRFDEAPFMGCRTNALAYNLVKSPKALIVGGGSGTEILNAGYHGAETITVVEMNRDIVDLMAGPYSEFSGGIYGKENVRVVVEEGRGFLQRTKDRFDIIQISLMETMGSASAGVYGISENYLFTTEALMICLDRLTPGGLLSISRWIKHPPRDNIKLLAMAVEAMEKKGNNSPGRSLVMIRSWQTVTLLVKNGAIHEKEIERIRKFCEERLFDVSYYPGIREGDTNIFNKLEKDHFYHAAMKLFSPDREAFYATYPFHVRPATDNSPFFSHTIKMDMLKQYLGSFDRDLIPFMDFGYILIWIIMIVLFVLGMAFILIPMPFVLGKMQGLTATLLYFGSLGAAYMFLEISVMQQFMRYLHDPVFSASVVIGSFLVYSGVGALLSEKIGPVRWMHMATTVTVIAVAGGIFLNIDNWLLETLSRLPLWTRMAVCSLLIAPLAIPMGIPFPSGLARLAVNRKELIPWAWGINGFFSVMGSTGTVLIAVSWGFQAVVAVAVALYILSAIMFVRLRG